MRYLVSIILMITLFDGVTYFIREVTFQENSHVKVRLCVKDGMIAQCLED